MLILDEPTVGLDPRQITEVRDLIKGFGREHTVILSTHILPEVSMVCSRVLIVDDGKEVAEDTPENLTRQLRGSEAIQVDGARAARRRHGPPARGAAASCPSTSAGDGHGDGVASLHHRAPSPAPTSARHLARAVVDGGFGLLELRMAGVSLEDVFLRLTTEEARTTPRDEAAA